MASGTASSRVLPSWRGDSKTAPGCKPRTPRRGRGATSSISTTSLDSSRPIVGRGVESFSVTSLSVAAAARREATLIGMSTRTEELRVLTLRAPASISEQLEQLARSRDRSVSGEIRVAIREHLQRAGDEPGPRP